MGDRVEILLLTDAKTALLEMGREGKFSANDGFTVHKAEERQHSAAEGECGRFHKLLVDDERANGAKHQPREDRATAQRLQAGVENADAAELGERLRLFRPLMKSSDASGDTLQARQSTSTISAHLAAVLAWINFFAHALAR